MARPTDFSQEIADKICEQISDGESLRTICEADDMPNRSTVFRWLAKNKEFCDQYAHAREEQIETKVDEINEIADDGRNDWMEKKDKDGNCIGWILNGEAVQRSKLRIEAIKWQAEKIKPKKYGQKIQNEISNKDGEIFKVENKNLTDEQINARILELTSKSSQVGSNGVVGRTASKKSKK